MGYGVGAPRAKRKSLVFSDLRVKFLKKIFLCKKIKFLG